eukprot:TRINITY_DN9362_c0_g1_i5.p3 TRINITY_DN9362_c0_g1~~TRINITY_DN9362_c0_g1_i5.p3  ORF type:complete len:150 (+),score=15.65 TRINITY_DN9362_c0_g1_i5:223-672(+)
MPTDAGGNPVSCAAACTPTLSVSKDAPAVRAIARPPWSLLGRPAAMLRPVTGPLGKKVHIPVLGSAKVPSRIEIPQIIFKTRDGQIIDDYRDGYLWLKRNTPGQVPGLDSPEDNARAMGRHLGDYVLIWAGGQCVQVHPHGPHRGVDPL